MAHGTGTFAAIVFLLLLKLTDRSTRTKVTSDAPLWAYLGGVSGAATVILTSIAANSSIALSGTVAFALAGQVLFSLAADHWGLFGLPSRKLDLRDFAAVALIFSGSLIIIFFGKGAL
jgi:transporter family-2 protein